MAMLISGSLLHSLLRDRGFGAFGNGFFLFLGLALGIGFAALWQQFV